MINKNEFLEVVRAMNYVISQGWAMYWGTAKWSATEVRFIRFICSLQ